MTNSSTITSRPREAICPPWCEGHDNDGYQNWEQQTDGGSDLRNHCDRGTVIGGVYVGLSAVEYRTTGLQQAGVVVTDDDMGTIHELSDEEAHELGMAILTAAATVRAFERDRGHRNAFELGRDYERMQSE